MLIVGNYNDILQNNDFYSSHLINSKKSLIRDDKRLLCKGEILFKFHFDIKQDSNWQKSENCTLHRGFNVECQAKKVSEIHHTQKTT